MPKRWVRVPVMIEEKEGLVAAFGDFVKYVTRESEEQSSLFDRRVFASKTETKPSNVKGSSEQPKGAKSKSSYSFSINSYTKKARFRCWFCKDGGHRLHDCPKFKELPVQEKSNFAKARRLCYKCLRSTHRTNMCKRANTCTVSGCTGHYHLTLLLNSKAYRKVTPQRVDQESACDTQTASKDMEPCTSARLITYNNLSLEGVYLCVVPVKVQHKGKTVLTYAFLDQGSTHSLCDSKLVQALGVTGQEESMSFQTLGHPATICRGVSLTLSVLSLDGLHSVNLPNVFSIENIPINPNVIPAKGVLNTMPHLSEITFQRIPDATVTLLIGADVPEVFCPIDVRQTRRMSAFELKTITLRNFSRFLKENMHVCNQCKCKTEYSENN